MTKFRIAGPGNAVDPVGSVITMRCPVCHQMGTFEPNNVTDLYAIEKNGTAYIFGQRRCPDPKCAAHVFFIRDSNQGTVLASFPAERIDFDTTNVPAAVSAAMEEAITCHANDCLIAAAIMVRKCLEELCNDRAATGKNLKERIRDLGKKIVLPQELLEGLDDLRLLGNDAAHIESQEFNQIGQEEVEIGIEFTKEVLKATYQYSALLSKLRSLKKPATVSGT
jgi:Domain of unknown function (DUF4145)